MSEYPLADIGNGHSYQLWQVNHGPVTLENSLCNNESPCQGHFLSLSLLLQRYKNFFQGLEVVVIVPPDGRAGDLHALLDTKRHTTVCNDNIATLAESRDDGDSRGKALRVEDSVLSTQEVSHLALQVKMHIWKGLSAPEYHKSIGVTHQ